MKLKQQVEQELKRYPRHVQVAYDLGHYLIRRKDRIPLKDRVGQFALLGVEIPEACRRFKCKRKTFLKAVVILKEMGFASPLLPHQ